MEKLLQKGVAISLHPSDQRKDRILISTQNYQAGQLVYSESTQLYSAHPQARQYRPLPNSLASDWQRLIFVWSILMSSASNNNSSFYKSVLDSLSTDGCTSQVAREQEPKRFGIYKTQAQQLKKHFKKYPKLLKNGGPSELELERMIHILETNCLSADIADEIIDQMDDEAVGEDDEELVGIWPLTSMIEHSCFPNCTFNINQNIHASDKETLASIDIRAVREIRIGDILTISYNDKEFHPTSERRQLLLARGFECHCDLCDGRVDEYCNMYLDTAMNLKANYPAQLSDDEIHDISKIVLENFVAVLDDLLFSPNMDATFFKTGLEFDLIKETARRLHLEKKNHEPIINYQIYSSIKSVLYSELGLFSVFHKDVPAWAACIWLVYTNVVLMKHVGWLYGEDLKHNLFWSVQTLTDHLDRMPDGDQKDVMKHILNQFIDKLKEQELVLQA